MDTETAIETMIAPQLVDVLGQHVATVLLTQATLRYVTTDGDEIERYEAFVRAICTDDRLISVWGEREAARQEAEWKTFTM